MVTLIFLAGIVGYGAMILVTNPHTKEISAVSAIRTALRMIGIVQPAWRTLIVSATQDVNVPLETIWTAWTCLEDWPRWSASMYRSTRWIGSAGWQVGGKFEQTVELGIPLGSRRTIETIGECDPMRRVRWCKTSGGIKSCHVWSFTVLPNGKTRITNTEVFHGTFIGLIKPIVAGQWERSFNATVTGLAQQARKSA